MMRICSLIPAFNEASHIAHVVEGARKYVESVIVIDDGSSDDTAKLARNAGAFCLELPANLGKAAALRHGFNHALAENFTHAVTLDGDGQHLPQDIPALLRVARETDADLVIGARPFDRALMPRDRFYSNTIGSRWASALVGSEIQDSQSGFRLYRLESLSRAKLRSRRYELEMETLIKLGRAGCTIAHAPIHMVYDNGHARSKMMPVRDTVSICMWSLAYRFLGA
ncbi:MAG TPA: glycosyltransferase family 2 protein [Terracidiphilus sp.]|jgi:glycosyltransferase involved in cell wall biosynthesis